MKKLALFMGMVAGICAHQAKAQTTPQQMLEEAISLADMAKDSTCLEYLSQDKLPNNGGYKSMILKFFYNKDATGRITTDNILAFRIFEKDVNEYQSSSEFVLNATTPEQRKEMIADSEWVWNAKQPFTLIPVAGGCPVYK